MPSATSSTTRDPVMLGLSIASAVGVLAGGLLHLKVWDSDYRDLPDGRIPGLWVVKTGFPLNAAASVVVAGLVVAVALGALPAIRRLAAPAALLVELGSIIALVMSRGSGIFDWTEKGYEGDAKQILVVEIVSSVLLVATIAYAIVRHRPRHGDT